MPKLLISFGAVIVLLLNAALISASTCLLSVQRLLRMTLDDAQCDGA